LSVRLVTAMTVGSSLTRGVVRVTNLHRIAYVNLGASKSMRNWDI